MIRRILVPLDGSKLAEIALPYALELQDKFKADLILAWVLHPPIILSDYGTSAYGHALAVEKQIAQSYLTTMQIKCHQSEHPVRILLLNGPPADTIIDTACQTCVDVIVMSTHGRSGLNRWVHGSVAAKVLAHAPCPVFLIQAKETAS